MSDDHPQEPPAPWHPPRIEKTPLRPAPTEVYSWKDYNPSARVVYIRSASLADVELAKLNPPEGPLGFDLEWKPTFVRGAGENPAALVQISNHDTILLLQITAMRGEFPIKLAEILADPRIVKCGVGIQGDAKKLYDDYHMPIRNCVDLSLLARTVDNARWQGKYNSSIGLAHLVESYMYKLMEKGKVTRSNWEAVLSEEQKEYASNDAYAGYALYAHLASAIPLMTQHDAAWYTFDYTDGFLANTSGGQWYAQNPNYDAGPQPPTLTKEQKEEKERKKEERRAERLAKRAVLDAESAASGQGDQGEGSTDTWSRPWMRPSYAQQAPATQGVPMHSNFQSHPHPRGGGRANYGSDFGRPNHTHHGQGQDYLSDTSISHPRGRGRGGARGRGGWRGGVRTINPGFPMSNGSQAYIHGPQFVPSSLSVARGSYNNRDDIHATAIASGSVSSGNMRGGYRGGRGREGRGGGTRPTSSGNGSGRRQDQESPGATDTNGQGQDGNTHPSPNFNDNGKRRAQGNTDTPPPQDRNNNNYPNANGTAHNQRWQPRRRPARTNVATPAS